MTKKTTTITLLSVLATVIGTAVGVAHNAAAVKSDRSLSSISYSYNDGLTICLCNAVHDCVRQVSLDESAEINLCFVTSTSSETVVEELIYLTLEVPGHSQQQDEQDIVQDSVLVQEGATMHYSPHSCSVQVPLAKLFDFSQETPETIVVQGSILLRYSDNDEEPTDIQFAQVLKLTDDDVPEIPSTPPRTPRGANPQQQQPGESEEAPTATSGYAMITGVVILLPGVWGVAMYAYHKMFRDTSDDEDDEDVADIYGIDETEVQGKMKGHAGQAISIAKVEDAIAAVDRMMMAMEEEKGEWETITDL
jgi:hypothetical protein